MNKNNDLIVRKAHGAYCVQLTQPFSDPQLFWSTRPYDGELHPLGAMRGQEMWIPSPDKKHRIYFAVKGGNEALWAADTAVEVCAVENFRDMGGYRTQDGRTVKWGRFFRCGGVSGMEGDERCIYENMRIGSIFDYRSETEAREQPDVYGEWTNYHFVPGIATTGGGENGMADMDMETQLRKIHTAEDADAMYGMFLSLYSSLPFHNEAYRAMFASLDSEAALPMIQHCSAGKDRTGVGCALLLLALGVDEGTVLEDYLLSAIFREDVNVRYVDKLAGEGLGPHALALVARMMTVTPDMLTRSFDEIKKRYGSYDAFLEADYGITEERRTIWRRMHTV